MGASIGRVALDKDFESWLVLKINGTTKRMPGNAVSSRKKRGLPVKQTSCIKMRNSRRIFGEKVQKIN